MNTALQMSSKSLTEPDALTFCHLMNLSPSLLDDAKNRPERMVDLGSLRIRYRIIDGTYTFSFNPWSN